MVAQNGVRPGEAEGDSTPAVGRSEHRPRSARRTVFIGMLLMLAVLLATNDWHLGIAPDTRTYEGIAEAAPGLPNTDIGSAFTERFASPWVAGVLGEVLPGGARTGLWMVVIVCTLAILALMISICGHIGLGSIATLLCLGLLVLNPYLLRGFTQQPATVDPLLVAGLALVIWALVTQRAAFLLVGALMAILGRQTAVLAIPAATVWLYAGDGWRSRPGRDRLLLAGTLVGIVAITYGALKMVTRSFTYSFAPSIPGETVLPVVGDPGSLSELVSHVARVAAPLLPVLACIAGVLVGLAWAGGRMRLPVEFWCALLIGFSVIVQPLLISPNFEGFESNQGRLSALGVFSLCVGLAYALRAVDARLSDAPGWMLATGALALLAASLNHGLAAVGPQTNTEFLAVVVLASGVLAMLLAVAIGGSRNSRPRPSTPSGISHP